MSDTPKVSVAVITYNQEDFIRETLDSILAQDYPNIEIVVSDDASTDGTQDILKEYASKRPGIFKLILSSNNVGITANCNRAFLECSGKYIAWLGGDDLFYEGKISAQVNDMEKDIRYDLSYHAVRVFDSKTDKTISITNLNDVKRRNLESLLLDGISLPGSSVMLRRSSCPVEGFDLSISTASDWLFYMESMLFGYAVRTDGVLGGYRIHSTNATHKSLIVDMKKTYAKIRRLRPDLKFAISKSEAITHFHEGRKALLNGDNISAKRILFAGIKLDPMYSSNYFWLGMSFINPKVLSKIKTLKKSMHRMRTFGRIDNGI